MNDIDVIGDDDEGGSVANNKDGICSQDGLPARSDSLFSLPAATAKEEDKGADLLGPLENSSSTSLIRSSIELSRSGQQQHLKALQSKRAPHYRQQQGTTGGALHFRKKSTGLHNRSGSRAAVLQRFQQRRSSGAMLADNGIVTIAALKAALSQSSVSYLDTGDALAHHHNKKRNCQQQTAVFVSEYL